MNHLLLTIFILLGTNVSYGIQIYPSGISVDFDAPSEATRKNYLLQNTEEIEKESLKTYRIIRVINGLKDIPSKESLALVFYNNKNKVIGHQMIVDSKKLGANEMFFIDRNSGRNFQGLLDIYSIPKKTVSFALAFVNQKGKVLAQPFKHPDFNEQNQITLEQFLNISPAKNIMLQYEINGTYENPDVKLVGFHFVK